MNETFRQTFRSVRARAGVPVPAPARALLQAAAAVCLSVTIASAAQDSGGPRLVLIPQRSVPMFSCTVLVPAGSVLETPETNGAAHYLEHLLFNGTETRTRERIYSEGDLLGAYNNASTQRERTVFQLLLPSENWKEGLELQSDMLLHSTLPEDMFEKEKGIILEELAKDRTSPDYLAGRRKEEILWGDDPRALPVLGTEESIDGMDLEALRAFYHDRYRPGGMTIVLMGDFDEAAARAEIRRLYGEAGDAPSPLPPLPAFPSPPARHFRAVPDLGKTEVTVMLPMPGITSPDYAAAEILARVLNEGEDSAVSPAVEAAAGPVQSCGAGLDAGDPWSLLTISADLPPDAEGGPRAAGAAAVDAVLSHLRALADGSAIASDLAAAQRGALVEEISLHEKMHYYGLMRADLLGGPDPSLAGELPERIRDAGAPEVTGVLRDALGAGQVVAIVVADGLDEGDEPLGEDPFGIAGAVLAAAPAAEGSAMPPAPPAVSAPESRRIVFDNGFTLVVKTTPDSRTFAAHLLLRDRARREKADGVPRGTSDVVHRMMALGTENLTEDELRGDLARLGASLKVTDFDWIPYDDYYFSPEYSYVRLETIDSFALDALGLMGRIVLHPRWTEDTFAKAKAAAVARASREESTPRSVATTLFLDALGTGHPEEGGVLGPAAELEALDLAAARRHHASMTAPDAMALVVSGDLPVAEIERTVRAAFDFGPPHPLPDDVGWHPAKNPGGVRESGTGREQSWIIVGAPLDAGTPDDDPALRVAVSVLSERLAEQLREREGLAYSIGAVARLEGEGRYVRMQAGTRPENLDRMQAGMREVAAGLATRPPGDEEIAGARNRGEGRRRMRRLSRMGDAYAMAMAELAHRDPLALDADLPALRAVTPDDVARVASGNLVFDPAVVAIAR